MITSEVLRLAEGYVQVQSLGHGGEVVECAGRSV
jgi:hypothetical protein